MQDHAIERSAAMVLDTNPEQQGLKHSADWILPASYWVLDTNPEQQGLKHWEFK